MNRRHALFFAAALPSFFVSPVARAQTPPPPAATPAPAAPAPAAAAPAPASAAPATPAGPTTEATTDSRALAETLFFTGRGLMEGGRFAQACLKFAESYRLDPAAGTLINLAVCHEKEGKTASAWGEFRQALAEAKRMNRPEREQLAKDAIARLEPDLAYLSIVVPAPVRVPGLQVLRNGVPLLAGAWDTELPIDPGSNEIGATAPDYLPESKTVTIEKKQHLTVTLDPLTYHPPEKPPPPFWTAQRKLGAGIFAGGVAVAAVGVVFGVLTLNEKKTSDDGCPGFDGQQWCTQSGVSAMSTAKTDAWVSDIGLGLGVAALVTGGVLFATGGAKEEAASEPPPVGVPPKDARRDQPGKQDKGQWGWLVGPGSHGGFQGALSHSF